MNASQHPMLRTKKENAYLENLGRFHVCLCEQIDASVTRVKVVTDHRSSDGIRENLQTCLFAQTVIWNTWRNVFQSASIHKSYTFIVIRLWSNKYHIVHIFCFKWVYSIETWFWLLSAKVISVSNYKICNSVKWMVCLRLKDINV